MGADPQTGQIYTPEERDRLDAAVNERLEDVTRQEYEQLREMTLGERVHWLSERGKDRKTASVGRNAKRKAQARSHAKAARASKQRNRS